MGWRDMIGWPSAPPPYADGIVAEQRAANPLENPGISLSANSDELLALFGISRGGAELPAVSIESAMQVPAVLGAVNFLSSTLASLPLHAYKGEQVKVDGDLAMLLNEAPNPEWSSFDWRKYMWTGVFTGGRGLTYIERAGGPGSKVLALWPMDPELTTVRRINGRKVYVFDGREYPAADVIDITFMLRSNQIGAYGPIWMARKAIALAIAMQDFAGTFFAGGGVPPLALEGPLPSGPEAFKRAQADIQRAIDNAKKAGTPFFGMPPGHALKPLGFDPAKGQMTEARLFQIQEIARAWGLPPVFLQDLSKGTFANTEQQDLNLVKHKLTHCAKQLEDEINLKLFGQRRRTRKVKHNLDAVQRGDFKSRIEGIARAIQTGQLTPNEARALEERPPLPHGDDLLVQGATVPLGSTTAQIGHNGGPALDPTEEDNADAGNQQAED